MRISLSEILLTESILFTLLWLWDDYVALILTISIPSIIAAVLIISLISEQIERSKIPRRFFKWLFWTIFPPLIIAGIYSFFIEGQYNWLQEI